eukprot:7089776-Pyramimonas_sp.AAC.1
MAALPAAPAPTASPPLPPPVETPPHATGYAAAANTQRNLDQGMRNNLFHRRRGRGGPPQR